MNLFLIDLQSYVLQLISVLLDFFLQVWILTSVPTPPYLLLKVEFSNLDIYVQIVFVKYISKYKYLSPASHITAQSRILNFEIQIQIQI